jgi:GNAT superfamily N-acetyltransferase
MRIREGTPADRDTIVTFDHVAQTDPARVRFIDRILRSATCLVAERDRTVAAYGALEYTFYEQGFVSMLYVAQPHRRQGIGRALMQALAARCDTPKLFTSTNQSNQPMQRLLTGLGYVPSGVIHNLDPGDPELVYMLDLRGRAA